jgi:membrane glycosyltransferase
VRSSVNAVDTTIEIKYYLDATIENRDMQQAPEPNWFRRRSIFGILVLVNIIALGIWFWTALPSHSGVLGAVQLALFIVLCFYISLQSWDSLLGFVLLRVAPSGGDLRSGVLTGAPWNASADARVVVAMTMRNEDPHSAFARLRAIQEDLGRTRSAHMFDYAVLSDSSDQKITAMEERLVDAWRADGKAGALIYRRRASNIGFRGGNVREFCMGSSHLYRFMVLLDVDSFMSAGAIVGLVEVMIHNRNIGLLQTFPVGLPSTSLFGRVYQFGVRHRLRNSLTGEIWWQGDCCQYWGHNSIIRVAPYVEMGSLPVLPGTSAVSGAIISHDPIDAALMYRAGYQVRFTVGDGSWEGTPPTLIDCARRNRRWCIGALQNLRLVSAPGFFALSRLQLLLGSSRYMAAVALALLVFSCALSTEAWTADVSGLFLACVGLYVLPTFLGVIDVILVDATKFGGVARLLASGIVELAQRLLLAPIFAFCTTFQIAALPFSKGFKWNRQEREGHKVTWKDAVWEFWPVTAGALLILGRLVTFAPGEIALFLPFLIGPILSIPLAVMTASTRLENLARKFRICSTPEEISQIPELRFRDFRQNA